MRSTVLTMCLLLTLWAAGNLPTEASAQSLLRGATASDHTIPAGWTLVAVQGFESGSVPSTQYISAPITTAQAHSGTRAMGGTISGDAQAIRWALFQGNHTSREVYLSFWEYMSADGSFNDEMFQAFFKIVRPNGTEFQHVYWDWYWAANNQYNQPAGQLLVASEGVGAGELHLTRYNTICCTGVGPQLGQWAQFEVHYKSNTPGLSDGFFVGYVNGVQRVNVQNANINGSFDMRGMIVQAGGTYTRHVWRHPADNSCGRYIGDGAAIKKAGYPDSNYRCMDFNNCSCPPNTQPFERYFDDVIVMVPSGGATDTSAPMAPSGLKIQ